MANEKSGHVIACTIAIDAEGDIVAVKLDHTTGMDNAALADIFDQLASMLEDQDDTSH